MSCAFQNSSQSWTGGETSLYDFPFVHWCPMSISAHITAFRTASTSMGMSEFVGGGVASIQTQPTSASAAAWRIVSREASQTRLAKLGDVRKSNASGDCERIHSLQPMWAVLMVAGIFVCCRDVCNDSQFVVRCECPFFSHIRILRYRLRRLGIQ